MQTATELTPNQLTFLEWVTRGMSIPDAAKEIDVRWIQIIDWKRSNAAFLVALEEALEYRALLNRERAQELYYEALAVVQEVIRDRSASPSLRLRASLAAIKISTTDTQAEHKTQPKSENVHNSAQPQPIRRPVEPGRNSICPCGSGAKFKRCCGNPVPAATATEADQEATAA